MTKVAAIVGPTAVGKTEIALDVAEALGAEIVSIDSMQAYRGMNVGTAKPDDAARARVAHHLVDVVDASHDLTVAEFQRLARAAIADIAGRSRLPLLVGGSGLYFRAVVDDLAFPPRSDATRRDLEVELEVVGPEALHRRLSELDPVAAARIEPANGRRTVRALEVIELTGRPFSDNAAWDRYESVYELAVAGLTRSRTELATRIERRVDAMLAAGLDVEARALDDAGLARNPRQALGYRQVLDADTDKDRATVAAAIVTATRRFARRQESWFHADPRVVWHDAGEEGVAATLATYFRRALRLP